MTLNKIETAQKQVHTFRQGIEAFFRGQKYVLMQHPGLLKYCAVPMLLGLIILGASGAFFFLHVDEVIDWLWSRPEHWVWQIFWYIFSALAIILTAVTTVLVSTLAFMIICAPFNDMLSERVEELEGSFEIRPFDLRFLIRDAWQSIVLELIRVFYKLLWLIPIYAISLLVPVIGQIIYIAVGGYKMSIALGAAGIDWSLARRGYNAEERLAFTRQHKSALLGFGLMMTIVSFIPLGAIVCWPGSVAGGTLLCTGLSPEDKRKGCTGASSDHVQCSKTQSCEKR